ncbi:MAG TPA: hypothetical protein VM260_01225 [Pirellula sp.]|nr:hypothetical protein [Pirellula sp.]
MRNFWSRSVFLFKLRTLLCLRCHCLSHDAVYPKLCTPAIISALVFSLTGSVLILARSIWRVGFGGKKCRPVEYSCSVLFFGAASVITLDLLQEGRVLFPKPLEMYSEFSCLLLFMGLTLGAYHASTPLGSAFTLRRRPSSWLFILVAIAMTGWTHHRIQIHSSSFICLGLSEGVPGVLELDKEFSGATDEGTSIPLFRFATDAKLFEEYASLSEERFRSFSNLMIHRKDADETANCHGWVFTGGRFLLKGIDVDRILCDNQYFLVNDPRPSDVVIYRDVLRHILHTALVQGILSDGTVITESKWGIDQRFLHLPTDQPYSQTFEYYRTNRQSHLIRIRESTVSEEDTDD